MMDSFEFNKIAGALLATLLLLMGLGIVSNAIFSAHAPEKSAYALPEAPEGGSGPTAPVQEALVIAKHLGSADATKGAAAAKAACSACHTFEKGGAVKQGPNLYNIVGQPIAARAGYSYSNALKDLAEKNKTWSFQLLAEFLNNPRKVASGTKMAYGGMKPVGRLSDIVVYLRSLSDNPQPLPAAPPPDAAKADPAKTSAQQKSPAANADTPKTPAPPKGAPAAADPAKNEPAKNAPTNNNPASNTPAKNDPAKGAAAPAPAKPDPAAKKAGPNTAPAPQTPAPQTPAPQAPAPAKP